MKARHTRGPWKAEGIDGLWVTGPILTDPVICDLVPRDADAYTDEDEANAMLIAAAPELLEAAIYAAWRADPYGETYSRLTAGIAKATGRDVTEVRKALGGPLATEGAL